MVGVEKRGRAGSGPIDNTRGANECFPWVVETRPIGVFCGTGSSRYIEVFETGGILPPAGSTVLITFLGPAPRPLALVALKAY